MPDTKKQTARESEESKIVDKILIETARRPSDIPSEQHYVDFRYILSGISFSKPIKCYDKQKDDKLRLQTWYLGSPGEGHYWSIMLAHGNTIHIANKTSFDDLNEPFENYSKERLKKWQDGAIDMHRRALQKLEELYWQNQEIPEDFFDLIDEEKRFE